MFKTLKIFKNITTWELCNLLLLIFTVFIALSSYFLEYWVGLIPCLLCLLERYIVLGLGIGCVLNLAVFRWSTIFQWIGTFLQLVLTLVGLSLSLRHVYLQMLPREFIPSCVTSFDRIFSQYDWTGLLKYIFLDSHDCGKEDFVLLYLSLPEWILVAFLSIFALNLFQIKSLLDKTR